MVERKAYLTDLSEGEWTLVAPLIPPAKLGGRPRSVDMREILNALFYRLRTGCSWEMLPHDLPPHQTVYEYFNQWSKDGTWAQINDRLVRRVRQQAGRDPEPSAAILDSQSVKTDQKGANGAMMPPRKLRVVNGIS